jgi:Golgi nucleoside diphosphatase
MFRYNSRDFPTVLLVFHGTTLKIRTLVDAAEALLSQWPDDDGEEFVVAVKKCLDAITGVVPADHARQAFIAAAQEAGMRVISLAHDAEATLDHEKNAA